MYTFNNKEKLGNSWGEINLRGLAFQNGEQALSGLKYLLLSQRATDPERKELLEIYSQTFVLNGLTPDLIRRGGRRSITLTREELMFWESARIDIQREICIQKYQRYPEIREILKTFGFFVYISTASKNPHISNKEFAARVWDGRIVDGEIIGKNMLGEIWMKIHTEACS